MDTQTRLTLNNLLTAVLMHKLNIKEITITNDDLAAAKTAMNDGKSSADIMFKLDKDSKNPAFTVKIIPVDE